MAGRPTRCVVRSGIRRGVPSLFTDLKSLYRVAEKATVTEGIVNECLEAVRARVVFVCLRVAGSVCAGV